MPATPNLHVPSINVEATDLPETLADGFVQWTIA